MCEPKTKVVNLYKSKYDIYIGRAGKGQTGYWGNPIPIGKPCPLCSEIHNRVGVLVCYEQYLRERIDSDPIFRERLKALNGKVLGCFCKPKGCHGDLMVKHIHILNGIEESEEITDDNEELSIFTLLQDK